MKTGTNKTPDILYLLSPSYSGSTLLTFLLAAHPEIASVGELKASGLGDITTYRCSCGALLGECGFWMRLRQDMEQRGGSLSFADFGTHFNRGPWIFRRLITLGVRNPMLAGLSTWALEILPPWRKRLMKIVEQNRLLIELITTNQQRPFFLDSSKDPERVRQFQNTGMWNVKVIRLLRDGRGIVNSYMKHCKTDIKSATREWLRTERACARISSELPPNDVLTVRYEEICREPEVALSRIFAFAGLSAFLPQHQPTTSELHILGNAMRLDPKKSIQVDEKWRRELLPDELGLFDTMAGAYNRHHGYI